MSAPADASSLEPLQIAVTRFCYQPITGYGAFQYKLDRIKQSKQHHCFYYPSENILKVEPTAAGCSKIVLFNKLYVPQCNSIAMQIELDGAVFSPNMQGKLARVFDEFVFKENDVCEWTSIATSDLAFSAMSMIHSLVETRNGFFHVGISLVPSCPVPIPIWMSDETMDEWLQDWAGNKMAKALEKSSLTVVYLKNGTSIQTLSHDQRAKNTSTAKWLSK